MERKASPSEIRMRDPLEGGDRRRTAVNSTASTTAIWVRTHIDSTTIVGHERDSGLTTFGSGDSNSAALSDADFCRRPPPPPPPCRAKGESSHVAVNKSLCAMRHTVHFSVTSRRRIDYQLVIGLNWVFQKV